jgi:hypothetical protein
MSGLPDPPAASRRRSRRWWLVVPLALAGFVVYATFALYSCTDDVLNGVPITIGDRAVEAMAQRDLGTLLAGDYRRYYVAFEDRDILDESYRAGFERAIDSAIGVPVTRQCSLRVGPVDRIRGGLDAGSNRLAFAATATCGRRRLAIDVEYVGDGGRPEEYALSRVVFHARAARFAAAALRIHHAGPPSSPQCGRHRRPPRATCLHGKTTNIHRVNEYRLRSDRSSDEEMRSDHVPPDAPPSRAVRLKPNERPDDRTRVRRMGRLWGWSGCVPSRRPPRVTVDHHSGALAVYVTYEVRCARHVERG